MPHKSGRLKKYSGKKIVVADESAATRKLVATLFGEAGIQVIEAGDGKEALCRIAENNPDLVLMEIHMPIVDGIRASKIIKNSPIHKDSKIILMSSDYQTLSKAGKEPLVIDEMLRKPFAMSELINSLENALRPNA